MKQQARHIQIICDTHLEYFRDVIIGARHYGFTSGRIIFNDHWEHYQNTDMSAVVREKRIQGIIAQIDDVQTQSRILELGIPVVNIANVIADPKLHVVTQDDYEVGALAAEHLMASNCKAYLCCARVGTRFSDERVAGFETRLRDLGGSTQIHILNCPRASENTAREQVHSIARWLDEHRHLRPFGIFTVLDIYGLYTMQALQLLDWKMPEEVAIVGAGNDAFLVNFENIPLSSIALPAYQIGYRAAQVIDTLLSTPSSSPIFERLKPTDIIKRRSSDIIFVGNEALAKALAFIRNTAIRGPLEVARVVEASGLSRSVLQRRFRQQIGRSIRQEIQRIRIENAKESLRSSNAKIAEIAEYNGFPSSQRFNVVFAKETGMTPGQYRKNLRAN